MLILSAYLLYPHVMEGAARFLMVRDRLEPADMILVLAGDDNGERVRESVELYRQGYAREILMSGGPLAWRLTAAEWMKKQAVAMGVPARAVLTEDRSESTLENALFVLSVLKGRGTKSVILVTSPTHSRRADRVFRKVLPPQGIKVISSPVPLEKSEFRVDRWWTRHEDTQQVVWEYVSLVYYFLKGY